MGDVLCIIHLKLKFGGDIWGGFVPYYIPEGGCVPYFFPDRRFYSGQQILHFVIVTHEFYLLNQFDWPKMTYTEFTLIAFTA